MKVVTPEISWHGKDAIFSIDVQCLLKGQPRRLATAGLDGNVRIWQLKNEEIIFLSNLSRHDKAVNVVRFSKTGSLLASAGDDGTVVLWRLNDKEEGQNIFDVEGSNVEVWSTFKLLRGHLEDVNDLSWSFDDLHLVTGSVDHTAILWDVEKGQKLAILSDAKHFVNGVAWDPLGQYVVTMSCDRSLRIYNAQTKKIVHCVNKTSYNKEDSKSDAQPQKPQRIFHDETVVRRRLNFTVDGKMLITPAGCLQVDGSSQQINTAMIFARNSLSKPCVFLPGLEEPAGIVACCPTLFELRPVTNGKEPIFKLDYRHIFAVASSDTVLLYDTQQTTPLGMISNIHYASITDLSWSSDASFLAVSSRDGFCSIVHFETDELGVKYTAATAAVKTQGLPKIDNETAACNGVGEKNAQPSALVETPPVETMVTDVDNDGACKMKDEEIIDKSNQEKVPASNKNTSTSSPQPRRVTLTTISTSSPSPLSMEKAPSASTASSQAPSQHGNKPSNAKNASRRIALIPVTPSES